MLKRLHAFIRRSPRLLNRDEWLISLLGLPRKTGADNNRGLVMIQIDGLAHSHFRQAMEKGYMPFLQHLMRSEGYQLHHHYPGLPTNTPAVQGELFFGIRQCVPAFQYRDRETGRVFTMYEMKSAFEVENRLKARGEGLLQNGSGYGNILAGGAEEAHLCAADSGWKAFLRAFNPWSVFITILFNPLIIMRAIVLAFLECVLAVFDVLRGLMKYDLRAELQFILTRVLVTIVLRELITVRARMDIWRGLPIVHLNYFAYDEQAHRRGATTRFAFWSLKGIDDAIKRLWQASHRAHRCHYEVWVYSDHGQEDTRAYPLEFGKSIEEAVRDLYRSRFEREAEETRPSEAKPSKASRFSDVGTTFSTLLHGHKDHEYGEGEAQGLVVTAMGPVGHVYFPRSMEEDEKRTFAQALARECHVPVVALPLPGRRTEFWAASTHYRLPDDAERLFGKSHPYLKELGEDLLDLCEHPDRGDLIIFGWHSGVKALSFPNEHGSHAGFGPSETDAFALLPEHAPIEKKEPFLRPTHIRNAALKVLGRGHPRISRHERERKHGDEIWVMTYNVHSCIGMDGRLSTERISRVIARYDPDIVALQELDAGRLRSGGPNQADMIARKLEMEFNFHHVYGPEDQAFGNAVLSRYPVRLVRAGHLPGLARKLLLEIRGVLWVDVLFPGKKIAVFNTHLSLWNQERAWQMKALMSKEWLGSEIVRHQPVVFCGDFNASAKSSIFRNLTRQFTDVDKSIHAGRARKTWSSQLPVRRLDYIFVNKELQVVDVEVPGRTLERVASDHLPVLAKLRLS